MGNPAAIVASNRPEAAIQFSLGRGKTVYVDPYSGAILGVSSTAARDFFFKMEQVHRVLGAPLGSKSVGHWLAAISNLLFGVLILLGVVLWLPRKWSSKAVRASIAFRSGLRGKARDWNWHNVIGIWCALPLLVIVLTGVVMSFEWADTLLFRLTGSATLAARRDGGDRHPYDHNLQSGQEPNYDYLFTIAKSLTPDWRTITLNVANDPNAPVSATIDTGAGGQPQKRTQYLLNRHSGAVVKMTGEYGGWPGQLIGALTSLGACVLVYTGMALAFRRFTAVLKRQRQRVDTARETYQEQPNW